MTRRLGKFVSTTCHRFAVRFPNTVRSTHLSKFLDNCTNLVRRHHTQLADKKYIQHTRLTHLGNSCLLLTANASTKGLPGLSTCSLNLARLFQWNRTGRQRRRTSFSQTRCRMGAGTCMMAAEGGWKKQKPSPRISEYCQMHNTTPGDWQGQGKARGR